MTGYDIAYEALKTKLNDKMPLGQFMFILSLFRVDELGMTYDNEVVYEYADAYHDGLWFNDDWWEGQEVVVIGIIDLVKVCNDYLKSITHDFSSGKGESVLKLWIFRKSTGVKY